MGWFHHLVHTFDKVIHNPVFEVIQPEFALANILAEKGTHLLGNLGTGLLAGGAIAGGVATAQPETTKIEELSHTIMEPTGTSGALNAFTEGVPSPTYFGGQDTWDSSAPSFMMSPQESPVFSEEVVQAPPSPPADSGLTSLASFLPVAASLL